MVPMSASFGKKSLLHETANSAMMTPWCNVNVNISSNCPDLPDRNSKFEMLNNSHNIIWTVNVTIIVELISISCCKCNTMLTIVNQTMFLFWTWKELCNFLNLSPRNIVLFQRIDNIDNYVYGEFYLL